MWRARLPCLDPATECTLTRLLEMRRHWDIPASYPGNVVTSTTNSSTLQGIVEGRLGVVAAQLREKLDPVVLRYGMQVHVTAMAHGVDRPAAVPTDMSRSIVVSSWSATNCSDLDFGLGLGMPVSVRRSQFVPIEGSVILLPEAKDGEIVARICLRKDDMETLNRRRGHEVCSVYWMINIYIHGAFGRWQMTGHAQLRLHKDLGRPEFLTVRNAGGSGTVLAPGVRGA